MRTVWESLCPVDTVLTNGADEDTLPFLLDTLNWAFNLLSDGADAIVATRWTGDVGATSKPITVSRSIGGTRLRIRRGDAEAGYLIGPRLPTSTALIEPGREAPGRKTLLLVRVLETQIRHVLGSAPERLSAHRDRLTALEAFARTSGRLPEDLLCQAAMATPWSPMRAYAIDGRGTRCASVLTRSETKAWTMPPCLGCVVSAEDRRADVTLDALACNLRHPDHPSDPIQDMRLIASLPAIRRR